MTLCKCYVKLAVVDLWIIDNSSKTKCNLQDITKKRNTKGLRIRSHYEVLIVLFIVILLLSVTIKSQKDSVPVSHPCGANLYTLGKKERKRMMFPFAKHEPMLCLQNLPERINFTGDWFVTNKLLRILKILGLFVGFTIFRKIPQKVTKNILLNIKII